jgi:hypothetical protein
VRDGSRNDVARELVAFANADGGTLIIGIEESEDDPKRAKSIKPVLNCHDVAERLRRAVFEIIEPKLPMLHSRAIDAGDDGGGVIVFSVPHSRRAPHRVESLRDCFRRFGNESRKMTMREIQELTLSVATGAEKLEKRFLELDNNFATMMPRLQARMRSDPNNQAHFCDLRFSAIPLNALWLGRVVGRGELKSLMPTISYDIFQRRETINYPWGREPRAGSPIVRGERRLMVGSSLTLFDEIHCDGSVTIAAIHLSDRLFFGWILSQVSALLSTIDNLRSVAGAPDTEYAIQLNIQTNGQRLKLTSDQGFFDDEYRFTSGPQKFPTYSYGTRGERAMLVNEIAQDIVHSLGSKIELELNAEIQD